MRVKTHLSIRKMQQELEQRNDALTLKITRREELEQHLKHQATTDPLAKLLNRRQFFDHTERELSCSGRKNRPISLIMMDIDHYKQVNDTYGQIIGDRVSERVAEICQGNFRK